MPSTPLRVAVFAPVRQLFDYLPPLTGTALPGSRVRIPFGRTTRIGVVTEQVAQCDIDPARLKPITEVLDETPLLEADAIAFLLWVAGYYQQPPGEVFATALPSLLRMGEDLPNDLIDGWRLSELGRATPPERLARAPKQASLLAFLHHHPAGLSQAELMAVASVSRAALISLKEKGLIEALSLRPNLPTPQEAPAPPLNPEQQLAVERARSSSGFQVFLLDGVTGSGKTEVYLEIARATLQRGQQVLVLVPEISLTPQTLHRFAQRLGITPHLLHSGLGDKERALTWIQASRGEARLLLGTRSAILTPMPALGLVIVDEEHDLSFKQQEGIRYSARDLAIVRAQRAGCPVLLGSATPSLESLHNLRAGRFTELRLSRRAGTAQPPTLSLIDIRSAPLEAGISRALFHEIQQTLGRGDQALLFLNRRGYAPVLICHDCGWTAQCRHCDARLTVHRQELGLSCHHCGHTQRMPRECPQCQGARLVTMGQGTEQVEEVLRARFPSHSAVRIDRDSTRRKGSLHHLLEQIHQGSHSLLLGTQMLAKGHDFPDVTLVGILDVDQGLFGADFRATERMAQLIVQVAGRAGRAEKPGRVLIQTRHADHPLLGLLIQRGYRTFAATLLNERRDAGLPPFSYQAMLRAESPRRDEVLPFLDQALHLGHGLRIPGITLWGPATAPMERRAGRYRYQLLIQSDQRPHLHRYLAQWLVAIETIKVGRHLRWSIDVDPQEML